MKHDYKSYGKVLSDYFKLVKETARRKHISHDKAMDYLSRTRPYVFKPDPNDYMIEETEDDFPNDSEARDFILGR